MDGFDPRVYKIARQITEQVFGNPNEREAPTVHTEIPTWDPEQRQIATANDGVLRYFTYPGDINWAIVPKIKLKGVRLANPVKAHESLDKRMREFREHFWLREPNSSTLMLMTLGSRNTVQGLDDPIYGLYQFRTWSKVDRDKLVGLTGEELIKIWTRFGIDVEGTWPNQEAYDPRGGLPMSAAGIMLAHEYEGWTPDPWEWHANECIDPRRQYFKFRFPRVNIRLLFHLVEKFKLVFTNPVPYLKKAC